MTGSLTAVTFTPSSVARPLEPATRPFPGNRHRAPQGTGAARPPGNQRHAPHGIGAAHPREPTPRAPGNRRCVPPGTGAARRWERAPHAPGNRRRAHSCGSACLSGSTNTSTLSVSSRSNSEYQLSPLLCEYHCRAKQAPERNVKPQLRACVVGCIRVRSLPPRPTSLHLQSSVGLPHTKLAVTGGATHLYVTTTPAHLLRSRTPRATTNETAENGFQHGPDTTFRSPARMNPIKNCAQAAACLAQTPAPMTRGHWGLLGLGVVACLEPCRIEDGVQSI